MDGFFDLSRLSSRRILYGGAIVFGCYVLLVVALEAGPISREAERRANDNLRLAGHDWATAVSYGRGIEVRGKAPSANAAAAAVEAAGDDWSVRSAWADPTTAGAGESE